MDLKTYSANALAAKAFFIRLSKTWWIFRDFIGYGLLFSALKIKDLDGCVYQIGGVEEENKEPDGGEDLKRGGAAKGAIPELVQAADQEGYAITYG